MKVAEDDPLEVPLDGPGDADPTVGFNLAQAAVSFQEDSSPESIVGIIADYLINNETDTKNKKFVLKKYLHIHGSSEHRVKQTVQWWSPLATLQPSLPTLLKHLPRVISEGVASDESLSELGLDLLTLPRLETCSEARETMSCLVQHLAGRYPQSMHFQPPRPVQQFMDGVWKLAKREPGMLDSKLTASVLLLASRFTLEQEVLGLARSWLAWRRNHPSSSLNYESLAQWASSHGAASIMQKLTLSTQLFEAASLILLQLMSQGGARSCALVLLTRHLGCAGAPRPWEGRTLLLRQLPLLPAPVRAACLAVVRHGRLSPDLVLQLSPCHLSWVLLICQPILDHS